MFDDKRIDNILNNFDVIRRMKEELGNDFKYRLIGSYIGFSFDDEFNENTKIIKVDEDEEFIEVNDYQTKAIIGFFLSNL